MTSTRSRTQSRMIQMAALITFAVMAFCLSLHGQRRWTVTECDACDSGKLESSLRSILHQSSALGDVIPVIIQFKDETGSSFGAQDSAEILQEKALEAGIREVYAAGGIPTAYFSSVGAVSAEVDREALVHLANHPLVSRISIDHPVQADLATTAKTVGADQVWAMNLTSKSKIDGTGIRVAVVDSGIWPWGDLSGKKLWISEKFTTPDDVVSDSYGHGTHVAGIIAGTGSQSAPGSGYSEQYKGIAPGAQIISLKVLNPSGSGLTSSVLQALDWCIKNKERYNIRVINLSLGHPVYESYTTDPLCQMVERCVANGMVVVASAGNYGKGSDGSIVYGGITSPGNDPAAITVGAINTHDTPVRSDDTIATYSSRGPTAIDGLTKPDIVAPGNRVISVANDKGTLYSTYTSNIVYGTQRKKTSGDYYILNGSSMAAGVVSGTVALMLQANPSLTPNAVKAILAYTAERLTNPTILEQGNGYLNTEGAVRLARAIASNSSSLADGAQWIANPASVVPKSTIAGEAILWGGAILWGNYTLNGDAILWGGSILWGGGIMWGGAILWGGSTTYSWNDSMMVYKQPAFGEAILWGGGILWAGSIMSGNTQLWGSSVQVGCASVAGATKALWYPALLDPNSMRFNTEGILAYGESGQLSGLQVGPPGAWFYPPY